MSTRREGAPPVRRPARPAPAPAPIPAPPPAAPSALALRLGDTQLVRFFTHRRKLAFWSGLHKLNRAGIGHAEALRTLGSPGGGAVGRALEQAASAMDRGATLGQALTPHGHLLERTYVALAAFAEQTGTLETVLEGIVEDLETQQAIRHQAILPILYLCYLLGGLVVFGPLAAIGPALYSNPGGGGSPGAIYALGLLGNLLALALISGLWIGLPILLTTLGLDEPLDRFKLQNPVTGGLYRNLYGSRFFLGLGLAIKAGLGIQQALRLAVQATSSPYLSGQEAGIVRAIDRGGKLSETLATLRIVPREFLVLLAASERAGDLERGLAEVAQEARRTAVTSMKALMVLALVVIGGIVVLRIVALILRNVFGPIADWFRVIGTI